MKTYEEAKEKALFENDKKYDSDEWPIGTVAWDSFSAGSDFGAQYERERAGKLVEALKIFLKSEEDVDFNFNNLKQTLADYEAGKS